MVWVKDETVTFRLSLFHDGEFGVRGEAFLGGEAETGGGVWGGAERVDTVGRRREMCLGNGRELGA
jgi:hypothetical protein